MRGFDDIPLPPRLSEGDYNADDAEQVERRRELAALRDQQKDDFLARVLDDPVGRAWVWDQLVACHIFANRFMPGQPDATAFCLGERNIGLALLAQVMRVAPEQYVLMAQENG
jgi:hypothetical protein